MTRAFLVLLLATSAAVHLDAQPRCELEVDASETLHKEGTSEPIGTFKIKCTGPIPGGPGVPAQILITTNANITSPVLLPDGSTSAVLFDSRSNLISVGEFVNPNTISFDVPAERANEPQIEFFGGGVNVNSLVLTGALDDSLDADDAFQANVQFLILKGKVTRGTEETALEEKKIPIRESSRLSTQPVTINPRQSGSVPIGWTEAWPGGFHVAPYPVVNSNDPEIQRRREVIKQILDAHNSRTLFGSVENIGDGLQLFVPAEHRQGRLSGRLVSVNGSPQLPPAQDGYVPLTPVERRGTFAYRIDSSDPDEIEAFTPSIRTIAGDGASGTTYITLDRPITPPTPQLDTSRLSVCRTNLLYPYVTNRSGFDTGLAIANTSCDRFEPPYSHTNYRTFQPLFTVSNPAAPAGQIAIAPPAGTGGFPWLANFVRDEFTWGIIAPNGNAGPYTLSVNASTTKTNPARSNWLDVEATGTQTPFVLRARIRARALAPGQYPAVISLARPGAPTANIPLTLTVPPVGPKFTASGVVNAASYQPNLVAPGEAIVIFGERLGPANLALAGVDASGARATMAGGTRVLFDGVPAPMIYSSATQISCFVPYGVVTRGDARIEVEYNGVKSVPVRVLVTWAKPALLTADSSGGGLAAAVNQDGSFNSVTGALPGDVAVFYGVGAPQTEPASRDGAVYAAPLPRFTLPVRVFVNGVEVPAADVLYAGPAPGLTHGVWQLNLRLPANLARGTRPPIMVKIGDYWTQPGVRVNIR